MEKELYLPIRKWVEGKFQKDLDRVYRQPNRVVLDVSELYWLGQAGSWMHPDLAMVQVYRRPFQPVPTLELTTFEIKPEASDLLKGLHQTLAHSRVADFVYLVAPQGDRWTDQVIQQSVRFGVGLVDFVNERDLNSYRVLHNASRNSPDLDLRDQFLEAALSKKQDREDVERWLGISGGRV